MESYEALQRNELGSKCNATFLALVASLIMFQTSVSLLPLTVLQPSCCLLQCARQGCLSSGPSPAIPMAHYLPSFECFLFQRSSLVTSTTGAPCQTLSLLIQLYLSSQPLVAFHCATAIHYELFAYGPFLPLECNLHLSRDFVGFTQNSMFGT